ncbi:MAG: response regulator [Elainella sp. Prado103]|nr:response regulator [Elainella sp. Prado103]
MGRYTFSREFPLSRLLNQLIDPQMDGCLRLSGGSVFWLIYLRQGKLAYATNSIDPFGRFDRYLRRLSIQIPTLVSAIRIQVRLLFETPAEQPSPLCRDYEAIDWLIQQQHLTLAQAALLVEELAKEVIESLLSMQEGEGEWIPLDRAQLPLCCQIDLPSLLEFCQSRLRQRTAVGLPTSPGIRPTAFNSTSAYSLSSLAQQSAPLVQSTSIVPAPPHPSHSDFQRRRAYTIACIDDSPVVLKSIDRFLHDENCTVIMINDPVKALMQIIRSRPDLILLDVTMPNLDGYELCSLLRKHPHFRQTPVVMVTSHTGFIDRAKARLVGASGYLTKPFTQPDLVKMVFKHLT